MNKPTLRQIRESCGKKVSGKEVIHAAERELLRSTMDNGTAICEDASIEDADFAVSDYYMTCRTAYYLCNHAQMLIAEILRKFEEKS